MVVNRDCGLDPTDAVDRFTDETNIMLVTTSENSGLAASRNLGIASSSGRFLAFLDDYDCLYPEHLELLVTEALAQGGETIVYSSDAIKLVEDASGVPRAT